ncbi:Txe/YoeB family addiction module toxin [Aliarcobacter cryaerophilus]|jgi:toxin YoeB|uniref:Putative mRNA interferase YoeB n=3 Tax=Arcobacteraceae TaxID=2808963 RepID=A0AAU0P4R1_9BACT|nr:Txe/YoeB family addiction module toxin [Aliarcobacter cryaerophilus]WNL16896.1 Txe/YoeB family addiction module toxin [Arcobacter sp. AZ-2023]WPD04005.1 Txe/YoeB family addiction module toxin [Arcobacter sp. DSM 115972]MCT7473532.1 Txe/YoeB family addiction module toxin [Aliarcobacter cryaerophilus]MCT7484861.1 Txe/YoeB family addiction module toxin [Aliarcobacter cryaerophilus]MCT7506422.1 Txe/YoeB family addiction module toxin [Aliarcobacter cryaerophilus]
MKQVAFEEKAFEDFTNWASQDKKLYTKIIALIKDIKRSPFLGLGKPEPLKHELSGYWSRRINDEHRLVYKVTDTMIIIASCKYHY